MIFYIGIISLLITLAKAQSGISYYNRPQYNCTIPRIIQGEWYSREKNLDTVTIIDATIMTRRGTCMVHETDFGSTYTFLFSQNPSDRGSCYHCVKIYVRTVNIIEKQETGCVTLENGEIPTLQNICRRMDPETQLITFFAENYTPINCRSSLEGVFHFAYQVSNKYSISLGLN